MKPVAPANPGHEASDASLRVIGVIAAALAIGVAAVLLVSYALFAGTRGRRPLGPELGKRADFQNGPEERTAIAQDWAELDAENRRNLTTYGWIDRRAGIVRIPVDRAMDLMAGEKR